MQQEQPEVDDYYDYDVKILMSWRWLGYYGEHNMTVAVNTVMVVMVAIVYMLHFCQIKNTVRPWNRWRAAISVEVIYLLIWTTRKGVLTLSVDDFFLVFSN